ncbi:TMEM175 family protein [Methanobacterium aggregans]|uniref:TMEM175 family protein n=1 Tax=Methanobacterium aggregans TaxID=1615586 RepID=UPI001AE43AFD|nr:TMEM175 family protein [Methanobacterium aggregans]MBP2046586.1 putative membrane protein [Methanobacterium aggregans]
MSNFEESDNFMTSNRMLALTDGIFAIAMTLLVLSIGVPHVSGQISNTAIQESLYTIVSPFISFVLSFILLAMFWVVNHRQLHYVKHVDDAFLWINIIWLLFIVIVPFTTDLTGTYGGYTVSQLIFNLNLLGIAFFLYLSWYYATRKGLVSSKINKKKLDSMRRTCLLFIAVSAVATGLSFIIPNGSSIVYLILLVEKVI